ncbi:MAG: hypothetical protein K6G64_07100 [Eubacterium sp.]|nr:hypothetical protein [Eubacterium sp.]
MMKQKRMRGKRYGIRTKVMATALATAIIMSGCTGGNEGGPEGDKNSDKLGQTKTALGATNLKDKKVKGELSLMIWAGDGKYYEDMGHQELKPEDITAANVAQVYAVAHKFNETYPNVKINLWSKQGDPDQPGTPKWEQEMENFKATYGKYPDIWGATDVPGDIKKGLVADLSCYANDETYKAYNAKLMSNLNYYGFQAGLPSYTIPAGIWVNKSLASSKNIAIPEPDWDIDDYTEFVSNTDHSSYWGSKGTASGIVDIGVNSINKQLNETNTVDVNNDEVKSLLSYMNEWSQSTVDTDNGAGNVSMEIMKECSDYAWFFFTKNRTLTESEDPWYITAAADESASKSDTYLNASDWDIYPYPATDYCENTIRIVMDPICIHNYASDDNNKEWSDAEKQKRDIAYAFATYWTASTEAKKAIFDQKYMEGTQIKDTTTGDSFPVVSGDAFEEQMEIWNQVEAHKTYETKEGWQKVLEIWKNGKYWDYSDKCTLLSITKNGETQRCLYEWENKWDENVAGCWMTDKNWVDNVKAKLADWNTRMNERLNTASEQLKIALKENYNFTPKE